MTESDRGEILKASSPGRDQLKIGMDVTTFDRHRVGTIKEIGENEFLLERPLAHDLWVPLSAILATEDFTANYRGPVQPTEVVLEVSRAHIDRRGWRQA